MEPSARRALGACVASVVVIFGAAGCASRPVPTDRISVAERAVQGAERAGAVEFAPIELRNAREKLGAAQKAAAERDAERTDRLAAQAELDAQLAEATARAQKGERVVGEIEDSLRALQRETQRPAQP